MTTLLPDIKSRDWQISTAGIGVIAEGLQDIRQCLDILLRTTKGADPLRPQFGSDIFRYVDKPLTVAIPNIKKCIIEAVSIWEKRVTIQSIRHEIENLSTVHFFVTYRLVDDELIDILALYLNGGFVIVGEVQQGSLTLIALFPPNPHGRRYTVSLTVNGNEAFPRPPAIGFATTTHLYNWIVANWATYGSWFLGVDRITGYLPASQYQTASISIGITTLLRFYDEIPLQATDETYGVSLIADGAPAVTSPQFTTLEALLLWVRANWAAYGTWELEAYGLAPGDFHNSDFDSEDFNTVGSDPLYLLALYTETVTEAIIEVTANA